MPEIANIVKVTAAAGKRDKAIAALAPLVEATESEPGTLQYNVLADPTDEVTIWITELYTDEAALNAHMANPVMAELAGPMAELVDGPPEVHQLGVAHRKGGSAG